VTGLLPMAAGTPLADVHVLEADNPLLEPSPGLMIWTLVIFGITLWILKRYVFGPLSAAIERRRAQISQSLEEAERGRDEALKLLDQYRERLEQARREADEIRERGRKEGDRMRGELVATGEVQRDRLLADTQAQIEAQTRQALVGIRDEVAGLALLAAEKVTRRSLDDADHRRLIEEALGEAGVELLAADGHHPDGAGGG
jgi:F-type H+-transporting ATPase subunit b